MDQKQERNKSSQINQGDHKRSEHQGNKRQKGGSGAQNHYQRKDFVKERLESIAGPTTNLTSNNGPSSKKFSGRCRLYVGNLPNSMSEEQFKSMFTQFGEVAEAFLHKEKGFGFIKLDTKENAEAARVALDNVLKHGKYIKVRFASHGSALKVKNLSPWVSNELLGMAFSVFGDIERAVVIVDDRSRPVGEGIIEYSKKQSAQLALKHCTESCFLLTSSPRPVLVEPLDQRDEEEGLSEKKLQKSKEYYKEREIGPRLAEIGSFEYEFSNRWKKLFELEQQKRKNLEMEIEEGRNELEKQMGWLILQHEEKALRDRLKHLEEQAGMIQKERHFQREEEMRREEERRLHELKLRQQQEDVLHRSQSNMFLGSHDNVFQHHSQPDHPPIGQAFRPGFFPNHNVADSGPGVNMANMPQQMENMGGFQMKNKRRRF